MRLSPAILSGFVLTAPVPAVAETGPVDGELTALRTVVTAQTVAAQRAPLARVARLRSWTATVPLLEVPSEEELVVWPAQVPLLLDPSEYERPVVFEEPVVETPTALGPVETWSTPTWVALATLTAGVGLILTSHALAMAEEGEVGLSRHGSHPVAPWLLGFGVTLSVGAAGLLIYDATREDHISAARLQFASLRDP